MADYIYLLETRLSPAQQHAIGSIRAVARESQSTVFLTGGAVRDLTAGSSIRDLDLTLQGDPIKLRKAIERTGGQIIGENGASHQLFLMFPGGVRLELAAAVCVSFSKPGRPKYEFANITDDLRHRDFTANAMAVSLNEGSYGLLMDPLNGVADIENRELRLVSNYGFSEDPSRLIRAARLSSRLSWQLEEKTRVRYETGKAEGYIGALSLWNRGYELEEIFHEEDPIRVMRALETEGWLTALFPPLIAAKANTSALSELADKQGQLQAQSILSHAAALAFPLVTGKMPASEVTKLKQLFIRPGFVHEIDSIEGATRDFAAKMSAKEFASPSAAWKLLHSAEPNLVLSLFYSSKSPAVQSRLKTFLSESPSSRQRIPYAMMGEMRITPDLPDYAQLVDKLFFELMDGKLATPEEMKAFLEPYSPPAPPPPVNLRRARARKEARPSRAKGKKASGRGESVAVEEEAIGVADGLMEEGDLTGPDRGSEPTLVTPISKVAPSVSATPDSTEPAKKVPVPANRPAIVQAKAVPAPAKTSAVKVAPAKATAPAPFKASPARVSLPTQKAHAAKEGTAKGGSAAKRAVPVTAALPSKKATSGITPVKAAAKTVPQKHAAKKAVPARSPANTVTTAAKAPAKSPLTVKVSAAKAPAKGVATAKAPAKKAAPAKSSSVKKPSTVKKSAPAKKAVKSSRR